MFPTQIQTDRLGLEQFCRENVDVDESYDRFGVDAPHVEEIFGQIPDDPFVTGKDVSDFVDRSETEWETDEAAVYAVRPDDGEDGAGALAGYAHCWMRWDHRKAELGLLLDRPFWGREYATEVYLALTEMAFDLRGIEVVEIGHPVSNENSRRSVEKYVEVANGECTGITPNNEWCGDDLRDARRYAVRAADFAKRESNSNG